jgi:hypothetical protein
MSTQFQWQNPNAIIAKLTDELKRGGVAIATVPVRAVRRGAFELLAIAQRLAHKKTSTYVRSMTATVDDSNPTLVQAKVGAGVKYARFIEEGTGLYGPKAQAIPVSARFAKALWWGAFDGNGKPVLRRQVNIKGMRPQAVFGRAITEFVPRYGQIVRQELERNQK